VDTILYVCNKGLTTAGLAQFIKSHGPVVGRHRESLEFRRSSVHDIMGDLITVSERC
jgi:hypothetical protein